MNIVLIGMPSAGKSTVGKALAKRLDKEFIDTDTVLKEKEGCELKAIVESLGYEIFLQKQENAIAALKAENCIIATGGSVVYSQRSVNHLKNNGIVVYLKLGLNEIEQRIEPQRRLARTNGQGLKELYDERTPLYEKYADLTIDCKNKSIDSIVDEIVINMKA